MGGACNTNGGEEERVQVIGKILLGGPRRRWVDSIKMDLAEIDWRGVGWIGLAQDTDK
jgi:hypothetical protein